MTVTMTAKRLALVLVLFSCVPAVLALNTHLNVTIQETVHQNVTFARYFDLVENRTYSLIQGNITIANPGAETVFDTYIYLDNVENVLNAAFVQASGRDGFQVVYPDGTDNVFTVDANITGTWLNLGYDLDEDGTNDFVRVTDTHIIFNVSNEFRLHEFAFSNDTHNDIDISVTPAPLNMSFTITSFRNDTEYNEGADFAHVTVFGTVTTASRLDPAEITVTINDTARDYAVIHIPELRSGQQTVYVYNVSSVTVDPPLDIDTRYTNPEFETKVLAGERFWVQLIASNIATVGALTDVNITLYAQQVTVTNLTDPLVSETFNFTLHNLSADPVTSGDWANVYGNDTNDRVWSWVVNDSTMEIGGSFNISFQIQAPDTVGTSGTYHTLTQVLGYRINTTASRLRVMDVRARGAVTFNETKRIVSPQDNLSNNNVTWQTIPRVGTTENITYTLEKVTLWVTVTRDPNTPVDGLTREYTPVAQYINLTSSWTGSAWLFNFTDGSNAVTSPPPIVWIKPYWIIRNTGNQIINSSMTINGTDLYMNYIYVVNGYWLEVQKRVLDAGDGVFDIRIEVRNRGNGHTPRNMTVTIYDFIPSEFTAWNWSPGADNSSVVTGEFAGVAYQWDVGLRTNISTSFAPRGDPDQMDFFWINYSVNGTGDFRVSELYIIGLDPRAVDGAGAHEGVRIITSLASTSKEFLFLAVVVFLIAINVANFFMTSRIHRRLK